MSQGSRQLLSSNVLRHKHYGLKESFTCLFLDPSAPNYNPMGMFYSRTDNHHQSLDSTNCKSDIKRIKFWFEVPFNVLTRFSNSFQAISNNCSLWNCPEARRKDCYMANVEVNRGQTTQAGASGISSDGDLCGNPTVGTWEWVNRHSFSVYSTTFDTCHIHILLTKTTM